MNNTSNSIWQGYFKSHQLYEIIEKDLKRTRNEEPFFQKQSKTNPKETNLEVLKRILFIFAQKYPDICYVQGLNEILATIFYCFSIDQNPYFKIEVEEDSLTVIQMLVKAGFASSSSQARQLISGKGVKVNNEVITEFFASYETDKQPVVSKGKNNFARFIKK